MQATTNIEMTDCGRRFRLANPDPPTVSGRIQNWLDVDGSLIGESEPLLVGSGLPDAASWWTVEDSVVHDTQGPLTFIRQNSGPARGLGHIRLSWNAALHNTVGVSACGNGNGLPCPAVGYIRHIGSYFDGDAGLDVTANPDIAGPIGGFGWLLNLTDGAPVALDIAQIEVMPDTPLLLSIQYPVGTALSVTLSYPQSSRAAVWSRDATCQSAAHYYDTSTGLLTVRLVGGDRVFSRGGLTLPMSRSSQDVVIRANCTSANGIYCDASLSGSVLDPCPAGYNQTAYDSCCSEADTSVCQDVSTIYAATSGPSPSAGNLVSDPDFEGECGGRPWYAEGDPVLEIDQTSFASGTQSMKVTNRQSSWNGVRQDVTGIFLPGNTYRVSFYARMLNASANLALKLNVLLESGSYSYPGNEAIFDSSTWTQKTWEYTVPVDAVRVVLYVETPGNTEDFAVDGFVASFVSQSPTRNPTEVSAS